MPSLLADRAVSPIVGVVLLVTIAVCLAGIVAAGLGSWSLESGGQTAAFDLTVDGDSGALDLEYVAGDPIDVDDLTVTISVNGDPLARQPPVPFVGAPGYAGAPTGPFNAEADGRWEPGERAGIRVAGTNDPSIERGDAVEVAIAVDGRTVARLETTAT